MFSTPAYAQAAGAASDGGLLSGPFGQIFMFLPLLVLGYFLLFRPQQQRAKQHREMISKLTRGDTVVLNSGVIGKVTKVEDAEVAMEISKGVEVKVVKSMITEVRARGTPAPANDAKAADPLVK